MALAEKARAGGPRLRLGRMRPWERKGGSRDFAPEFAPTHLIWSTGGRRRRRDAAALLADLFAARTGYRVSE